MPNEAERPAQPVAIALAQPQPVGVLADAQPVGIGGADAAGGRAGLGRALGHAALQRHATASARLGCDPAPVSRYFTDSNDAGIVALAGIVTVTPGTVSSEVTEDRRYLLVHALHCTDPAALVADIQARYEAPLLEILG